MARQISVSDDVYEDLSRLKGKKSFSEFIREKISMSMDKEKILSLAGALKGDAVKLDKLKETIEKERKTNRGRNFNW